MAEEVGLRVTQLVSDAGLPASGGPFLRVRWAWYRGGV
jgi:hypothetical protein